LYEKRGEQKKQDGKKSSVFHSLINKG
jgi:hypothetical protein